MFTVFRAARCSPPPPSSFFSSSAAAAAGRTTATSQSFRPPPTPQKPMETTKQEEEEEEKKEKTSDAMSESFGLAYSTRSDEEGFGGTFGRHQSLPPQPQDAAAGREELQAREAEEGRKKEEKAGPAPA